MGHLYKFRLILLSLCPFFLNAQERISDGLITLYTFHEGSGEFIQDVSGTGTPLLLHINNPNSVQWIAGGGIEVQEPALIKSLSNANKIGEACQLSGEITMEMWVTPLNNVQDGPCRMLSVSNGINDRNLMVGQKNSRYVSRVRTTTTGNNGTPNLETPSGSVLSSLQHIVYTLNANGQEKMYINNILVASGTRTGSFDNWNLNYELFLANESSQDRPWLGNIYLTAVYSQALTASEITQNYNAGHIQNGASLSTETCDAVECFVDGFGFSQRILWLPDLPFPVGVDYMFDAAGGTFDVFEDGTAHIYGATWNLENPAYGWYIDVWFTDKMNWTEWSALGRGWKGSSTIVGNLYTTWDYYIMDPNKENMLIGLGEFEGNSLPVTHKPANYYYGFQVGLAANDQNNLPGMSCWMDYAGEIDGDYIDGNCDLNIEGECTNLPVLECVVDIVVDCANGWTPEITGTPIVNCEDEYTLTYSDNIVSIGCPVIIERTWIATGTFGEIISCTQTITVEDEVAPQINLESLVWENCDAWGDWNITATDNCDPDVDIVIEIIDSTWSGDNNCEPGMFRTQTQGGWGTNPNGNNPGVYLDAHFDETFPTGLIIGCDNQLILTSAQAVRDFLPSGSSPSALPSGTMTNPGESYSNVLAGQLVAATLSVAFDLTDESFGDSPFLLGDLEIVAGTFSGYTVNQFLVLANQVIGGCNNQYSYSEINETLSGINENFVDGTINNGFLDCEIPFDCYLLLNLEISATDNCGNSTQTTQLILVGDTAPPQFPNMPVDITVECGDVPGSELELVEECFGEAMIADFEEIEFSGACFPTLMRTWTAADQCGNITSFTQYIHVTDSQAPVFVNSPSDLNLDCNQQIPEFTPVVTDNCDENVLVILNETETSDGCTTIITRTWTATDNCQNISSITQVISIVDNLPPAAPGLEPVLQINCDEIPPVSEVTFLDECGVAMVLSFNENSTGTACNLHIVRTWIVADWCGNTATFVQDIYSGDEIPPTAQNIPTAVVLNCGSALPGTEPIFTDNCGAVSVTYQEIPTSSPGMCDGVQRIWTATDACSNMTIVSQLVTFTDTNPPTFISIPQNMETVCGQIPEPAVLTATDNCDAEVGVTFSETTSASGCDIILTRIWVATDNCGNTTIASQTITVTDEVAPQFTATVEVFVDCADFALLSIDVEDDCSSDITLTWTDMVNGQGCEFDVFRTWTAIDECGNEDTFSQLIHVTDQTGPVFTSIPPDLTMNCGFVPFYEEPIVFDACDNDLQITYTEIQNGNTCSMQYLRTWVATDDCGNTTVAEQFITIVDNVPPVIHNVPEDQSWSCDEFIYTAPNGNVNATDNCDTGPQLSFSEETIPGCENTFQIVRTWTAVDDCENMAVAQQVISVSDTTPPVFDSIPEDLEAECGNIPAIPTLTATDNCSNPVNIVYSEANTSGGCPIIQRTWIATDACGNSAMVVQLIFIIDIIPPSITGVPPSGDASCNSIPPIPEPQASDDCDAIVDISFNESIVGSGCEYLIIRTWVAEDDCGNTSVISQTISVQDESGPVFVNPQPEITLECEDLDTYPGPDVVDDCASFVNVMFEDIVNGSGCDFEILRTYSALDLCGNSASFTQTIHIIDTAGPVISGVPFSGFYNYSDIPDPSDVVVSDACSGVVDTDFDEEQIGSGCNYQLVRTWTATDDCGNTSVAQQILYVGDIEAPILLGVPENLELNCGDMIPLAADVTTTDNCESNMFPPDLTFSELQQSDDCGITVTRFWMATDMCGNSSQATQVITISDNDAPVFDETPADVTTTCDNIPEISWPVVYDNCAQDFTVAFEESVIAGGCPYDIIRTWTATDNCGNVSEYTQLIHVEDFETPVLSGIPQDMIVNCGEIPEVPVVLANDNCLGSTPVVFEEDFTDGECSDLITRTWIASDLCGNIASGIQLITVIDTIGPQFELVLPDSWVECTDLPAVPEVSATDCNEFSITFEETIRETECDSEFNIVRVWTATDACGNQGELIHGITVVDTSAPVVSDFPEDLTVDCNNMPAVPEITVTDNCSEDLDIQFTEEIIYLNNNDSTCVLSNSIIPTGELVVWLPYLAGFGPEYVFGEAGGTLEQNPTDGTAHLTGQIYNTENANLSFMVDIYLREKRNWDEWSALGRSYKDDAGFAGDEYVNWFYYEMDESSTFIGAGDFEGNNLTLSHAPASFYYGFQLGWGANNLNGAYGMSGWFFYEGELNGSPVFGVGDIMTENSCCPDQQIIRTWVVTDCAGNMTTHTQNIYVSSQTEPYTLNFPDPELSNRMDISYPNGEEFRISFYLRSDGQVNLELYDIHGGLLTTIYQGHANADTEYTFRCPVNTFAAGAYVARLVQGDMQLTERGIVSR